MRCHELDRLIEGVVDGSFEPTTDDRAHLASCERCRTRLEYARSVEQFLATREAAAPPASFTAGVMARIGREKWRAERAIDIGFNLAVAAGVLLILAGGAGLAWSLGFLTVTIDIDAIYAVLDPQLTGRVMNQVQTIAMAAALLTMALVLWWWAEAASD